MSFTFLRLDENGFLRTLDHLTCHNAKLPEHAILQKWTSKRLALKERPRDPDAVLVQTNQRLIETMYFSPFQMKRGFYRRLNLFQSCYGTIKVREL